MPFRLDSVVPWGRSFEEYRRMFDLTDADLQGRVLGCADGPASFNAETTQRGHRVVSCDPLYQYSRLEIDGRIGATYTEVMEQTRRNRHEFVWTEFASPEDLGRARMAAMRTFLDDYETGRREGRYVAAELPSLPFPERSFDLALCSHFLFLYTNQLTADFHVRALLDLARVASEVRVFPILALGGTQSRHLNIVCERLEKIQVRVAVEPVAYEFLRGANHMLRVRRSTSQRTFHRTRATGGPPPQELQSETRDSETPNHEGE